MRLVLGLVAVLALCACGQAGSGGATSNPLTQPLQLTEMDGPAPGKWQLTTTDETGKEAASFEYCYKKRVSFAEAQEMEKEMGVTCSERSFVRKGGAIVGHSVCQMGDMKMTTDTYVTGDLESEYKMKVTSSIDPAPIPSAAHSVSEIHGKRLGDC